MLMQLFNRALSSTATGEKSGFDDFWYSSVGANSISGVRVTNQVIRQTSVAFACIDLLSRSMGMIPMMVYDIVPKADGTTSKKKATGTDLWRVLHNRPNRWQTPSEFKSMLTSHVLRRGNGYAMQVWGRNGDLEELWPLMPECVTPQLNEKRQMTYAVRNSKTGKVLIVPQSNMLHLRDTTYDGVMGASRTDAATNAIGLASAMEDFGAKFFKNGGAVGGVLKFPSGIKLQPEARERARAEFRRDFEGAEQASKVLILDEGMDFTKMTLTQDEAQFLESRRFQVEDICRFYRVPPHMVGSLERATFNSVEQMGINFVTYSLLPLMTMWEEACTRDLVLDEDTTFVEMNADMLMRGDASQRATAYNQAWWLSGNEIRAFENLNPMDDPAMDRVQIPLNRGNPGGAAQVPTNSNNSANTPNPPARASAADSLKARLQDLVTDAVGRVARAEHRELERIAESYAEKGQDNGTWLAGRLNTFYPKHRAYMVETMTPALDALFEALERPLISMPQVADTYIAERMQGMQAASSFADWMAAQNADSIAAVITGKVTPNESASDV